MRRTLFRFLIIPIIFCLFITQSAQGSQDLELYFFYSPTCPHCAAENSFLDSIDGKYKGLKINRYLASDSEVQDLLQELLIKNGAERYYGLVPLTFIGDDFFLGFNDSIGQDIELSIQGQLKQSTSDKNILGIDLKKYSLPLLAIILGFIDGFNICSLGALALILGLVLTLRSRKKIFIYGGLFILTTAIVYGLLIFVWYKIFSYLAPFERILGITIGIIGIIGGLYLFRQFYRYRKYGPTCDFTSGSDLISRISRRLKNVFEGSSSIFIIGLSVLFFAAAITIIEFPCSAAVPVIFTGLLAQANVSGLNYLFYILIFLIFYLLDELIIFFIAVTKMKMWLTSPKFVTWTAFIGGFILVLFGFYYLFGLV